ncbi:hypothetical protein [Xenorhabdus bovienii]|uniref:Uncharacterized protein n=1 Tax=Xenorhabdus bovienii str. kraussei Becker Underwood TaxID=1398204 RepID=A0A077PIZ1_XENBV|nr:hypothetical protein [Xenorhabdus bovienii]CDH24370.1 hypothetical protein XBKB1_2670021 [Xenorhabdus bovienii str. kraussei Becker Underwood]
MTDAELKGIIKEAVEDYRTGNAVYYSKEEAFALMDAHIAKKRANNKLPPQSK